MILFTSFIISKFLFEFENFFSKRKWYEDEKEELEEEKKISKKQ